MPTPDLLFAWMCGPVFRMLTRTLLATLLWSAAVRAEPPPALDLSTRLWIGGGLHGGMDRDDDALGRLLEFGVSFDFHGRDRESMLRLRAFEFALAGGSGPASGDEFRILHLSHASVSGSRDGDTHAKLGWWCELLQIRLGAPSEALETFRVVGGGLQFDLWTDPTLTRWVRVHLGAALDPYEVKRSDYGYIAWELSSLAGIEAELALDGAGRHLLVGALDCEVAGTRHGRCDADLAYEVFPFVLGPVPISLRAHARLTQWSTGDRLAVFDLGLRISLAP